VKESGDDVVAGCVTEFFQEAFGGNAQALLDFSSAEGGFGIDGEWVGPIDTMCAVVWLGGEGVVGVECVEDERVECGDGVGVGDAFAGGFAEDAHEGDAEGVGAGEVADFGLDDAGGNGRDAGDFVEGIAEFVDVGVFGGAGGISTEFGDGGIGVVGAPDDAGRDGGFVEAVEAFGQIHLEGLHSDARCAIGKSRVEFILEGDERFDFGETFVAEGLRGVLDVDDGEGRVWNERGVCCAGAAGGEREGRAGEDEFAGE